MSTQVPDTAGLREEPLALRAWEGLLRAHAATTRLLGASLQSEHGLTLNDYQALLALAARPGRRMRRVDLARALLLSPSGVTRLLEGLEGAGLVERHACATDGRVGYACLTDAGAERLEAASCGHVGSVRALLEAHLRADELRVLAALLGRLPGVADAAEPWAGDGVAATGTPAGAAAPRC